MLRRFTSAAFLWVALAGAFPALFAEESSWVFEGLVTQADPRLAPGLKSGWVLSGSFILDPLAMEEDIAASGTRSGRLTDGVSKAELTIDLYYQIHFQALQIPGIAGFDFIDDDPEAEGRDLVGWFFPMRGQLDDSEWSLRWLQVWLMDREGKMIRTTPPPIPPAGFEWKSSWFRLVFINEEDEEAHVEGSLDFFAPEEAVPPAEEDSRWGSMVADLGNQLKERDSRIAVMQKDLEETRARVESLRRMVDLLVEERSSLQEENSRLAGLSRPDNSQIEKQLAELEAAKALAEQDMEDMQSRNLALAETLGQSEKERLRLQKQLEEISSAREAGSPTPRRESREKITSPDGRDVGTITIIERPMVIEKPVEIPSTGPVEEVSSSAEEPDKSSRRSRFGPRKFR